MKKILAMLLATVMGSRMLYRMRRLTRIMTVLKR